MEQEQIESKIKAIKERIEAGDNLITALDAERVRAPVWQYWRKMGFHNLTFRKTTAPLSKEAIEDRQELIKRVGDYSREKNISLFQACKEIGVERAQYYRAVQYMARKKREDKPLAPKPLLAHKTPTKEVFLQTFHLPESKPEPGVEPVPQSGEGSFVVIIGNQDILDRTLEAVSQIFRKTA